MSPRKARRLSAELPRRPRPGTGRRASAGGGDRGAGEDPVIRLGPPQVQSWPDGDWVVRQVPGAAAAKMYRCPGCDQEILPGVAHVVVWVEQADKAEGRRHWHNSCWQRRPRRPGR
ncbi:MAG: ATP/GTP-binding protein [Streptosporangiaceae bacterium]